MFEWKVEEYKFKDMNDETIDCLVDSFNQDYQIKIIEKYGMFPTIRKFLKLVDKFKNDVESGVIKKQNNGWNKYNFNSVKAWYKRNNLTVPYMANYDDLMFLPKKSTYNRWSAYCRFDANEGELNEYIRDLCCRSIAHFRTVEQRHFNEHDEWTVENNKLCNRHLYDSSKYVGFSIWSSGKYTPNNKDYKDGRFLTLEELKALNSFYDDLEKSLEDFYKEKFKNFPMPIDN